jgi:osmotically-inducible protein OsmY
MSKIALLLFVVSAAFAASGCGDDDRTARRDDGNANQTESDRRQAETTADPTNTAVNERDRSDAYPTPDDQMANEPDMKLTQAIRQAIMDDESISMAAKNVKVITVNGHVTLRGPVKTAAEKAAIAAKAEQFAGATHVDNLIEVATD